MKALKIELNMRAYLAQYRVYLERISWLYAVTGGGVCFYPSLAHSRLPVHSKGLKGLPIRINIANKSHKLSVFQVCVFRDMKSI